MDVALDNDKAIQQDTAQQQEHAQAIGHHNVPGDHSCAAEDADAYLVGHKHNGPEHEEPATHVTVKQCSYMCHSRQDLDCKLTARESDA